MLVLSFLSLAAFLFHVSVRSVFSNALRLRLELESHRNTMEGKAAGLFLKNTVRVSLTLKAARSLFLIFTIIPLFIFLKNNALMWESAYGSFLLFTGLTALLVFVIADMFIANTSKLHPYFLLKLQAPFFLVSYVLFWPLSGILLFTRNRIFRHSDHASHNRKIPNVRSEDFEDLVSSLHEGSALTDAEPEMQILHNAMEFRDAQAGSCMIPRSELVAVDVNTPIEPLIRKFTETRLTRILIYRDSIEHIIGYIHSFEMFRKPVSIIAVIRPVIVIPETMPVKDLLTLFIRQKRNVAVVVDEYGRTSGMLTMEDVIEELFGEIDDEHDTEQIPK